MIGQLIHLRHLYISILVRVFSVLFTWKNIVELGVTLFPVHYSFKSMLKIFWNYNQTQRIFLEYSNLIRGKLSKISISGPFTQEIAIISDHNFCDLQDNYIVTSSLLRNYTPVLLFEGACNLRICLFTTTENRNHERRLKHWTVQTNCEREIFWNACGLKI